MRINRDRIIMENISPLWSLITVPNTFHSNGSRYVAPTLHRGGHAFKYRAQLVLGEGVARGGMFHMKVVPVYVHK